MLDDDVKEKKKKKRRQDQEQPSNPDHCVWRELNRHVMPRHDGGRVLRKKDFDE